MDRVLSYMLILGQVRLDHLVVGLVGSGQENSTHIQLSPEAPYFL